MHLILLINMLVTTAETSRGLLNGGFPLFHNDQLSALPPFIDQLFSIIEHGGGDVQGAQLCTHFISYAKVTGSLLMTSFPHLVP